MLPESNCWKPFGLRTAGNEVYSVIAARLATHMQSPQLKKRELDIVRLMAAGKSNKGIGASLGVTTGTARVRMSHILEKLGATGRADAIQIALERGIVHMDSYHGT